MKTAADIQAYLMKMELPYEEPREGTWVVQRHRRRRQHGRSRWPGRCWCSVSRSWRCPRHHREELFRTLLELNATEMMHGAYGIEGDSVVISDALQLENLDYNEFAATVDDITLAVASHHGRLASSGRPP